VGNVFLFFAGGQCLIGPMNLDEVVVINDFFFFFGVDFQVGFPHVCAVLRTIRRNGQQDSRVEYRVHETMNDFPQSVTLELRFECSTMVTSSTYITGIRS